MKDEILINDIIKNIDELLFQIDIYYALENIKKT